MSTTPQGNAPKANQPSLADPSTFAAFSKRLRAIVPHGALLTTAAECKPFECDGLSAFKQIPPLVALPDSIQQVQQIVSLCNTFKVPLVSRGAGTGLSGGATPHAEGLLMSLNRLNKVLEIDAANRRIHVQPGITNVAVSEAVADLGLFYAPDPSSQIASTIGGNIAENSGGIHCIKYGLTVHNVESVEVVLPTGELVRLNPANGPDLLGVLIGSEGMLGVVVAAWLRLTVKPPQVAITMAGFSSVDAAANAVAQIVASGITPAAMEMMDKATTQLVENYAGAGYPLNCEALLLCELDGEATDLEAQIDQAESILFGEGASILRTTKDAAERELMWKGRKSAFPAMGQQYSDYYCIDGTVPRKRLGEMLREIARLSGIRGLHVFNVFHAGDGNLHPLIVYDLAVPGQLHKALQLGDDILRAAIALGGTVTGEHGVGLEKLNVMCDQFTTAELEQFHRLRSAFDPNGIMNPGKAIPTLTRCAEVGGMHVHKGELPRPELELL